MSLVLKNPHSVLAAFGRPGAVASVTVTALKPGGGWGEVADAARRHGVPVKVGSERPHGARRGGGEKAGRLGGAEAVVKEVEPAPLDALFAGVDPNRFGLWLALDQVQDPHNVGAVFRTAAFFGVRGLIVTRDRSAPMSAVVYDTASGGVEHVPFAQPTNLRSALDSAKQAGLWVLGSSEHETGRKDGDKGGAPGAPAQDVFDVPRDRPWLLVLGNEQDGMRRLTGATCDAVCRLAPRGPVTSLNVSAAAAAMVAALCRP